ncbi:MAG: 16S rRNA (guanine(527)-N(7))-methyltransferase RsmG [Paludibacteraceae bacterium]|nr:16S rRNA (guanine(527)-N(7))-methyltransferase RsmG [Paludibacteraceae bacterium]MBR1922339.1 16S rRNA (guanine(527)-N(7))-methyltransferase RsmG [Paludibacteraceae bacterium]
MTEILKYFEMSVQQQSQMAAAERLYPEWNEKINLISRKDIAFLEEHHLLHSLAIAKVLRFAPGTTLLDVGTGGGFPGIPLAILFPDCQFTLIDSIGKKIRVAEDIARQLGLKNVTCIQTRAENVKEQFDFVVSRAVMTLPDLVKLVRKNVHHRHKNAMPNGLLVLKGGNIDSEIHTFRKTVEVTPISRFFPQEWFKEKFVIYLPL